MTIAAIDASAQDADASAAHSRGDFTLAAALLGDAIARFGSTPHRHAMLGQALLRLDRAREAATHLRLAYAARAHPPLLVPLGIALLLSEDARAAVSTLDEATAQLPKNPQAWNALALAHDALGDASRAEAAWRHALVVAPRFTPALANLCDLLVRRSRLDEAIAIAERAAYDHLDDAGAWFKLGHLLMLLPDPARAQDALLRSARLQPRHAQTYQNLGILGEWAARFDDAEIAYRQALSLDPGNADARFGLATILLKQRRADEGWTLYARGSSGNRAIPARRIHARQWQGEAILQGTLVIDADQGLGDVLQFIRFADLARARVARVLVFCDDYYAPLKPLLASMRAIDAIVDRSSGEHAVAATCTASELPQLLQLGAAAMAPCDAYLAPSAEAVRRWGVRTASLSGLKVGICWSGNPRTSGTDAHRIDQRRSIAARRMAMLADIPGVTLVSLQKGACSEDTRAFGPALVDWSSELVDFAETAALMAQLDLVVSVDTSVVHCAGATGREAWMLDRFDNCWRWGTDVGNPGWYRHLRVFRQATSGDWEPPVRQLHEALAARARLRP
ncbi:MAG: tetratricopeptide repeat protein [Betaproteobacteria bacterium]